MQTGVLAVAITWLLEEVPNPLLDSLTAGVLYSISDGFAQWQQHRQLVRKHRGSTGTTTARTPVWGGLQITRVLRFGSFGLMDGFCSHFWFNWLDSQGFASDTLGVGMKLLADFTLFTPNWCWVFIMYTSLYEGRGVKSAMAQVRRDWKELYTGNVITWFPFNVVLYGYVPLEYQVLAFSSFTVLYSIFLSLWTEGRLAVEDGERVE